MFPRLVLLAAAAACFAQPLAASPVLKDVAFAITNDVGYGNEVCVLGAHPALGGNDPLKAVKLSWNPGNVWSGTIALPAGELLGFKFVRRAFAATNWPSGASTDLSPAQTVQVPSHPAAPWPGKTVFLHSAWASANIYYRDLTAGATNWTTAPMRRAGAGRTTNESVFRAEGIASPGADLEFVFNDGAGEWLNAPAPPSGQAQGAAPATPVPYQGLAAPYNFRTRLDVFFVQDQQVFSYRPPAAPSAPRFETREVGSTVANIPGRPVTILLPRGYDQNPWKRYPVVYFHDGQNVFFPGGSFGTWDADRIANCETSQGRMREAILVAIPNGNAYGSDRLFEYLPDGDSITNYGGQGLNFTGRSSLYLQWMLTNLAPALDFNYRTLGGPDDTVTAGSSMGGLVSDYIGFNRPDRFGTVGIFSPAYWAATNYINSRTLAQQPLRRWISMGTAESSSGESSANVYWQGALAAYDGYLRAGQSANRDLAFTGVAGAQHNEAAWSRLLPSFFAWALDPWREANPLALENFPPHLAIAPSASGSPPSLRHTTLAGFRHQLEFTGDLARWTNGPSATNLQPWDESEQPAATISDRSFWRLQTSLPAR